MASGLVMRPARPADRDAIERFVQDRFAWMAANGLRAWRQSAAETADKALSPKAPMWVLADNADRPVGTTVLLERPGLPIFTAEERAQPCYVLAGTVTDPAYAGRGLGTAIAWWAVDRAARAGRDWVRRVTSEPALVAYYARQGFVVLRKQEHEGRLLCAMQRPAERLDVIATGD